MRDKSYFKLRILWAFFFLLIYEVLVFQTVTEISKYMYSKKKKLVLENQNKSWVGGKSVGR